MRVEVMIKYSGDIAYHCELSCACGVSESYKSDISDAIARVFLEMGKISRRKGVSQVGVVECLVNSINSDAALHHCICPAGSTVPISWH